MTWPSVPIIPSVFSSALRGGTFVELLLRQPQRAGRRRLIDDPGRLRRSELRWHARYCAEVPDVGSRRLRQER